MSGLRLPVDVEALRASLQHSALKDHSESIIQATQAVLEQRRHGDVPRWLEGLNGLPAPEQLKDLCVTLDADTVSATFTPTNDEPVKETLKRMSPWRKGPFQIGDVFIDTEWRSDWKWNRIKNALSPLEGRCVLDVGCGNGYHLWRLKAAGATTVLGIDPSPLFVIQFLALQRYVQDTQVNLLPLSMEQFDAPNAFDTVLSMGVLSHRRDPMEHIEQLKRCLKPGGELLLETLVLPSDASVDTADAIDAIDATDMADMADTTDTTDAALHLEKNESMIIEGRYARMRNVWELPTPARVIEWLLSAGFESAQFVSSENTSTEEQRTTEWMPFESLAEALDTENKALTIEGHPRPCRAVFLATSSADNCSHSR